MPSQKFPEKYFLALEQAVKEKPQGGLNGFEQEWNLLDEELRPLLTVGAGPSQQSFVDYLRAECIPPWQAAIQPARSLSLDDRVGDAPVLQPARRDLRSASHGSCA